MHTSNAINHFLNYRYALLRSCWDDKPEKRPTFTTILQTLEQFLGSMSEYVVLSGFRTDGCKDDNEQAYYKATPADQDHRLSSASLQNHIHAAPNQYSIAET